MVSLKKVRNKCSPRLGRGRGRKEQRNRTNQNIIAAAQHIFIEKGYPAATMIDIAAVANINKCTLYTFYPSKNMLWFVSASKYLEALLEINRPIMESDEKPEVKLIKLLYNHLCWNFEHRGLAILSRAERKELPPKLFRNYIKIREQYEKYFEIVIDEIYKSTGVKYHGSKITTYLILGLAGSLHGWYKPKGDLSAEQIADLVCEFTSAAMRLNYSLLKH